MKEKEQKKLKQLSEINMSDYDKFHHDPNCTCLKFLEFIEFCVDCGNHKFRSDKECLSCKFIAKEENRT